MSEIQKMSFPDILNSLTVISDEEAAEHDRQLEEAEKKATQEEEIRRYRKAVPYRYWKESFGTFDVFSSESKVLLDKVKAYTLEVQTGKFRTLCLIGNAGTGKTHLACAVIRALGYGAYKLSSEIISDIDRSRSFTASETEPEVIARYGRMRFLVIDEINRGFKAIDEQYMLYQVINARYNNSLPTVLIANNTKAEFFKYLGNAVLDRLQESGITAEATGESYRARKRQ